MRLGLVSVWVDVQPVGWADLGALALLRATFRAGRRAFSRQREHGNVYEVLYGTERTKKRRRSPDRPDVHRFVNRVAVLSGVKKFPSQFRSPKHIRDALQVVGHCSDADFSSCTR